MKIIVATPVAKYVEERYCHSLFGLTKYETWRGNDLHCILQRGPYIHMNRNLFVTQFLKSDAEWLLQIDMDVAFTHDVLERLLARKKEIVFASYAMLKGGNPRSTFFRFNKRNNLYDSVGEFGGGLIEVDAAGTGLCLAHRAVFEAVQAQRPDDHSAWFDFEPAPPPTWYYSEDITFCRRVRKAGFKLWGDCDIETWHLKDLLIPNHKRGQDGKEKRGKRGRRGTVSG